MTPTARLYENSTKLVEAVPKLVLVHLWANFNINIVMYCGLGKSNEYIGVASKWRIRHKIKLIDMPSYS